MAEDPDFDLLRAWRAGDREAGTALFDRYFDPVLRFFRTKVTDGADDLVQETFLACVRNRDGFRGDSSFRTYVFRVARSKLYDHFRSRERRPAIDFGVSSVVDIGESPSQLLAGDEEQRILLASLARLPLDLQVVLELFYLERIRGPELARILELPEGTVRTRVRRGLALLRDTIAKQNLDRDWTDVSIENLEAWAERVRGAMSPA